MRAISARQAVGVGVVALCALLPVALAAQAPDPMVGTWKLDVAKSTYKPGPPPKSATVTISPAAGKGLKVSVDAALAEGPLKFEYSNGRDGKDSPVTGHPQYDSVNVTQVSPTEGSIDYKKAGKTVVKAKTELSKDGKTMTVTSTGTDAKGTPIHNVAVYTR